VYREEATFFRAALLLGLTRGDAVVRWSDAVLAADPEARVREWLAENACGVR